MAKKPSQDDRRQSRPSSTMTAKRRNIPTAEIPVGHGQGATSVRDRLLYARNRDLDPQLVWRGKDEQDWTRLWSSRRRRSTSRRRSTRRC